jgi:hypothetical protein
MRVPPDNQSLIFGDVSLEALIVDIQNFLALYEDIEGDLNDEGNVMDVDGGLDVDVDVDVSLDVDGRRRGPGVGESGKALEKRSEDVARDVLKALEVLRDEEIL